MNLYNHFEKTVSKYSKRLNNITNINIGNNYD